MADDPHNRILQKCPACIQGYTISLGEDRLFYADFSSQINTLHLWHFYSFQLWRLPVLEVSGLDWTPFHSFQEFWFEHLHLPDLFP